MRLSVKVFEWLSAALVVTGLTACSSAPVVRTLAPTEQAPAPTALPSTPRLIPTPTSSQEPMPERNRVTATIHVGNAPGRMAVGDGFIWVVTHTDRSVIRIDPNTNQVVGKPIPAGIEPEAVAFGEGA